MRPLHIFTAVIIALIGSVFAAERAFVPTSELAAPEANQAAAADERYIYAIDNRRIAKYDRNTGQRLGQSSGEAFHLNSGFLWEGKLYCAHSNYPRQPAQSEIMVLDTESMKLGSYKQFGAYRGSLTWAVRRDGHWWCNFAHYGADNAKTVLLKLDDQWREQGEWTYPAAVIDDLGTYSLSGGVWFNDELLVTGHDKRVIYRLQLPAVGSELKLLERIATPFPGQGIALDPQSDALIGIDRARKRVVFASLQTR